MGEMGNAERICQTLQVELTAMRRLAYALEVQCLVLDRERQDLLAEAGRDVQDALNSVRAAGLLRAVTVTVIYTSAAQDTNQNLGPGRNFLFGEIVDVFLPFEQAVLLGIGDELSAALSSVCRIAEENRLCLVAARDQLMDDELALWTGAWKALSLCDEQCGVLEDAGERTAENLPVSGSLLDDMEWALFSQEDEMLASALVDLQLQSVTFEAALATLSTMECRPLRDFIADMGTV